jgi:ribosomal protein L32
MAKRATGVGKNKTSRSKKTKKRLAVKAERLSALAAKRRK